jgi:hypothetical protein
MIERDCAILGFSQVLVPADIYFWFLRIVHFILSLPAHKERLGCTHTADSDVSLQDLPGDGQAEV